MTGTNIVIRRATLDDIDAIVRFQQKMALESEGKQLDGDRLHKGVAAVFESNGQKGFYLVADVEGKPAASLLVTFEWSDWRNATFWWIQSVYVEPRFRRTGVYRAMHDHVYRTASTSDAVCGIRLYVDRNNHAAQQTYTSLGMAFSHYDLREIDFVL